MRSRQPLPPELPPPEPRPLIPRWAPQLLTPPTFPVAPGQSVTIPAQFWCLDFGKPFPTAVTGPSSQATDAVRKVLVAAPTNATDPYQTQLAVWQAADNTWHDQSGKGAAQAQQIFTASQDAALPTTQTLGQLIGDGGFVTVQSLTPVPDATDAPNSPYHGNGTVTASTQAASR